MSRYKVVNASRSQVTQGELLERDGDSYELPPASETEMGGVRVGARLFMVGNVLNAEDQRYDDTALALAVADNAADIQDLADALVPDLSEYATAQSVEQGDAEVLAEAKAYADGLAAGEVDLSTYATRTELADGLADGLAGKAPLAHEHEQYLTADDLPAAPDLSGYATDQELADGLATRAPVEHRHQASEIDGLPATPDLSAYATRDELSQGLAGKAAVVHEHEQYLTADDLPAAPTGVANVAHGADATVARPDAVIVFWYGSVEPVNMAEYDHYKEVAP